MCLNKRMQDSEKIKLYIQHQLRSGLQPNEISAQLAGSGWPAETIHQAFQAAQAEVMPSSIDQPPAVVSSAEDINNQPQSTPNLQATGKRRGKTKTGWLLFKQSLRILRINKSLIRYPLVSGLINLVLLIIFGVIFYLERHTVFIQTSINDPNKQAGLSHLGYLVAFVYYILAYFVSNLYGAGLAGNLLDIFQGKNLQYKTYMKKARSRAGTIFVFSLIAATVGIILQYVIERSRLVGRVVARLIGAVWSIATLFVDPIIISSDDSAVKSIKQSVRLLKSTWGENIVGRVSLGVVMLLAYFALIPVFVVIIVLASLMGSSIGGQLTGVLIGLAVCLIILLGFGLVVATATNVLNTALFYYATNKQVPAAFDADLLNSALIPRKKHRL